MGQDCNDWHEYLHERQDTAKAVMSIMPVSPERTFNRLDGVLIQMRLLMYRKSPSELFSIWSRLSGACTSMLRSSHRQSKAETVQRQRSTALEASCLNRTSRKLILP